jgi:hypothetical protein
MLQICLSSLEIFLQEAAITDLFDISPPPTSTFIPRNIVCNEKDMY